MEFRQLLMAVAAQDCSGPVAPTTLGAEMLTNGDMSSATGWTLNNRSGLATATISGGKLTLDDTTNAVVPDASQTGVLATAGAWYRIGVTLDSVTFPATISQITVFFGGKVKGCTATGVNTWDIQASTTGFFKISCDSNAGVLDNATCKPLT